ncbi:MAG: type I DNA topoisomerase [Armatimonadota bacterium]|nr:MAG: type I DNA topoisomerase [Armatimonadota bacterium]
MPKSLIIVESPAKTRTIRQFVGKNYLLEASMGHVRDLPKSSLGVDTEHDFKPKYVNIRERTSTLKKLREAAGKAKDIYIATDPDREGEAIAWHLTQALKIKGAKRIQFNEITRRAVTEALENPRTIDAHRVDAQQARRILDRLVGYTLSPLLQRKMRKWRLSAGRVQSVAVRLICEREREIQAFVPEQYWDIVAHVTPGAAEDAFQVKLVQKDGKKIEVRDVGHARRIASEIWESALRVARLETSDRARRPPPPFITSTLQQDAANRLGLSARQTMRLAQQLYEGVEVGDRGHVGLITYMRTDSTRVAREAQTEARAVISDQFGKDYLPPKPRQYQSRRSAQDAHEAIRPTSPALTPDQVDPYLDNSQSRLYKLIWSRFIASQMADLRLRITAVDVSAGPYLLRGRGVKILFPGFTAIYPTRDGEVTIPDLEENMWLDAVSLAARQRFTEPPPRYTEATLVKLLEAKGIGRPSTYAPIIGTIQDRGYVYLEEKRFHPTDLGFAVTDQLVEHFPDVISVEFTADMETKLDRIEEGAADWVAAVREFYKPFEKSVARAEQVMEKVTVSAQETDEVCEECGKPMLLRVGRHGPFLACSGYPECKTTRPAPGSKEEKRQKKPPPEPTDEVCDKCGSPMVIRTGRRGRFLACSAFPKCRSTRPLPEEEAAAAKAAENQKCDLCGRPMTLRRGRYGPFLGCTGYPDCKGIKRLPKSEAEKESG